VHTPKDVLQIGSLDEKKGNGSWTGVMGQLVRNVRAVSLKNAPFKMLVYYDDVMFFYFVSTDLTGSGHICPFLLALGFIRDRWL
jgi:hypothetical protein